MERRKPGEAAREAAAGVWMDVEDDGPAFEEDEAVPHVPFAELEASVYQKVHEDAAINFGSGAVRQAAMQERNRKLYESRRPPAEQAESDPEWDFETEDDHTAKVARRAAELVALDREEWLIEDEAHREAELEAWGRVAAADEDEAVDEPASYAVEAVTEDIPEDGDSE